MNIFTPKMILLMVLILLFLIGWWANDRGEKLLHRMCICGMLGIGWVYAILSIVRMAHE